MNVRIGDGPSIQPSIQSSILEEIKKTQTGQGASAQTGPVGPAGEPGSAVAMALAAFLPAMTGNFEARLAEITGKLKEVSGEVNKDRVMNEQENKRLNLKENQAKLEASQGKLEDAEAKGDAAKIFEYIGMAAQGLGALLLIVLGGALMATGGGSALGAAMMIAGGFMAAGLVNSLIQAETGNGIMGHAIKTVAPDADPGVLMAADIAFTVFLVANAIVATLATGGASTPALIASIGGAATQIAGGVASGTAAGLNISAAVDRNEGQMLQADTKETEAFMQQLDDIIDQALSMLLEASQRFNGVMDSVSDMVKETGDTLSNTRMAV